eukprot:14703596-Alexandrium_andersonii.AAC.1
MPPLEHQAKGDPRPGLGHELAPLTPVGQRRHERRATSERQRRSRPRLTMPAPPSRLSISTLADVEGEGGGPSR